MDAPLELTPAERGAVARRLVSWYRAARRSLPWRESVDAYGVWVSEVMLQQTRVDVVVPYYERFMARFPRLADLARAGEDEVVTLWSGLGYYRRARSLLEGARFIAARHAGEFPRDMEEALRIPGVGPYTAAAVTSIAYNLPFPVVDGNVERVLTRLFRLQGDPRRADPKRRLRAIAASLIPKRSASDFNQALMELGATICAPSRPACGDCPLGTVCGARRHGDVARFPETPPGRKLVPVTLHAAIVRQGGRYLVEKTTERGLLRNVWMFPFVEGDSFEDLLRALGTRLDGTFTARSCLEPVRHSITFRKITVRPTLIESSTSISTRRRRGFRWARLSELGRSLPVSSLALKIRERIQQHGLRGS